MLHPLHRVNQQKSEKLWRNIMKKILALFVLTVVVFSFVSFAGAGEKKTVNLKIKGMTCQGCVDKVQSTLKKVDGVSKSEVILASNSAVIVYDAQKTNEKDLRKAVNSTGFKVVEAKAVKVNSKKSGSCCGAGGKCSTDKTDKTI